MKNVKTLFSLLTLLAFFTLNAADITLTVTGTSALESESNTTLPNGNAVWIGSFNSGFDISSNAFDFALLSFNFGFFDDSGVFQGETQMLTTITTDFGLGFDGSFSVSGTVPDAGANSSTPGLSPPIYVWAFNNSDASLASEYGIFQLSNLESGLPPLGVSQSIDFANEFVVSEFGSFNSSTGVATLQAVPEPSTYALLAGILAFGFIVVRRYLV